MGAKPRTSWARTAARLDPTLASLGDSSCIERTESWVRYPCVARWRNRAWEASLSNASREAPAGLEDDRRRRVREGLPEVSGDLRHFQDRGRKGLEALRTGRQTDRRDGRAAHQRHGGRDPSAAWSFLAPRLEVVVDAPEGEERRLLRGPRGPQGQLAEGRPRHDLDPIAHAAIPCGQGVERDEVEGIVGDDHQPLRLPHRSAQGIEDQPAKNLARRAGRRFFSAGGLHQTQAARAGGACAHGLPPVHDGGVDGCRRTQLNALEGPVRAEHEGQVARLAIRLLPRLAIDGLPLVAPVAHRSFLGPERAGDGRSLASPHRGGEIGAGGQL